MTITNNSTTGTKSIVLRSHARYYDFVARLLTLGRRGTVHDRIVERASLISGERILDVGCGTGSLALAAKACVGVSGSVCGVDASTEMIERARHKARRGKLKVDFQIATVEALPFPDRSFDVVFSTLMLHHLPRLVRRRCASEVARVLRPGGRILVADFQIPARQRRGWMARFHRHGFVALEDVHELLTDAGLQILESGELGLSDLHFTLAAKEKS